MESKLIIHAMGFDLYIVNSQTKFEKMTKLALQFDCGGLELWPICQRIYNTWLWKKQTIFVFI